MANTEIRDGMIWIIESESEWMLGPISEPAGMVETLEDKITQLKNDNLIIMDAIATLYEDLILGGV